MKDCYEKMLTNFSFTKNDIAVIALSGGPDSMALLSLLRKISNKTGLQLVVAHVNHNTGRAGQKSDHLFVKDFCKKNNLILEDMIIESYKSDNFHKEAHQKRYHFFEDLIEKYHAKYLFTAHHGDDLMETILMRIVRGSSLKGYSGFQEVVERKNYKIVRPLISLTKDELLSYCQAENIPYVIDDSNEKETYTRNRYRKHVLPFLKNEDSNVHKKFYKFSKILLEYDNYVENQVQELLNSKNIIEKNNLNLEGFIKLDSFLSKRVLFTFLEQIYQDNLSLIDDNHILELQKLIHSKKANGNIFLPNNMEAQKCYNVLKIVPRKIQEPYKIVFENIAFLPNGMVLEQINSKVDNSNFTCCLNSSEIALPLIIRTKEKGDKMEVKGLNGSKKIKDIFIDSKISKEDRNEWPIVTDSKGEIIWLPGLKKSKFDKQKEEKYDIILKYHKKEEKYE